MFDSNLRLGQSRRASHACRHAMLACCLLLALRSGQAEPVLSLADALQSAQQRSRQLAAQDAAAAAAREMAIAAAQLPDPLLKGGITNLPIDGADRLTLTRDFMTMRSIGVMQEFTGQAKRQARKARFDRAAEVARAGRLVALARLQQEAATAWLERHYLDAQVDLLKSQRAEAKLQVEAADAAYRGGSGSQADVFAARSVVAEVDDRIQQALLESGSARIRLMRWIGESANLPLAAPPPLDQTRLNEAMLDRQLELHPQIVLLTRQQEAAQADVDLAQRNKQADWSVELMFSQRGPAYSNMISLTFAVPLQWDQPNRQDRDVAAGLATQEKVGAEREEALREVVAQTRLMLLELENMQQRLLNFDQALIPLAGERITAALADYRGGSGSLAAVLGARRTLIETRVARLRLEMARASLWARVNYLMPTEEVVVAATED